MKKLNTFLEAQENEAHKKAQAMGLEYRGFGFWADPATGEVTHRSSGDELTPTGGLEATPGDGEEDPGASQGQSFDGAMEAGAEAQLGEVKPGEAKAKKETTWIPGPDGDTDVGSEKDEESVEDDAFVGKNEDSDKWVAGPEGSNFTNVKSFDKMQEAVLGEANWTGKSKGEPLIPDTNSPRGKQPKHEAERRGLNSDGHGYWVDNAGNPVAKTEGGELVDLTPQEIKRHELGSRVPGRTTMRDMVKGNRTAKGLMKKRADAAKGNLAHLSPSERDRYIDARMKTRDGTYKAASEKGPYHKADDGREAVDRMTAADYADFKEGEDLTASSQEYFQDPEYDLDTVGEELGEGSFGSVYMGDDYQSVVKDGQIGRSELQALDLLKDIEGFPKLINGRFESGFKSISKWESETNGDIASDSDSDPAQMGTFWAESDAAKGRFAMSLAGGTPVHNVSLDEEEQEAMTAQFWNKMGMMHKKGVSHNDLHGGNIFYDYDEQELSIIDLGLAKVNRLTALMEGLASMSENNYQLSTEVGMVNLPQEMSDHLEANRQKLIEQMADDYSDESWEDSVGDLLETISEGDIRMSKEEVERITDELQLDEEQLQGYLDILYEGIGEDPDPRSDLEKRMEGGYKKMLDKMADASEFHNGDGQSALAFLQQLNAMRKKQGQPPIDVPGIDLSDDN